jgi:ketosteroid isomerase-like protein
VSGPTKLEAVNRGFAAWNSGDLEAFLDTVHPDVVWEPSGLFPDITTHYEGHDGVRQFWRDFVGPWDSISIEFVDVRELGGNALVVRVLFRGRGRGGIEVEQDFGQYYEVEGDLLYRMRSYVSWEEALAAAGAGKEEP